MAGRNDAAISAPEYSNVSAPIEGACNPTAEPQAPVRRNVRQKNIPITKTLKAKATLSSPLLWR